MYCATERGNWGAVRKQERSRMGSALGDQRNELKAERYRRWSGESANG